MLPISKSLIRAMSEFGFARINATQIIYENQTYNLEPVQCSRCNGSGKHLYGSLEGHAFSSDELQEDQDFFEDMMQGIYDVSCENCEGYGYYLELCKINSDCLLWKHVKEIEKWNKEEKQEIKNEMKMLGEI